MTKQLSSYVVVRDIVGSIPFWAVDESLSSVRVRFKRLTGKFPSKRASIIVFTGELKQLDSIGVNDLGDILYPKELIRAVIQ